MCAFSGVDALQSAGADSMDAGFGHDEIHRHM
jgi:hypothetical protein